MELRHFLDGKTMQGTMRSLFVAATLAAGAYLTSGPAFAATTLKINHVISNQDPSYKHWSAFASALEAESEGELKVELFPNETLGKTMDMIGAISRGAPVLQNTDPGQLFDFVPDLSVYMVPYLLKQPDDVAKLWNSDLGQELDQKLEQHGLRFVTIVYMGKRHLLSDKEVRQRADTRGMKIRNAPNRIWNEVSKMLGGNPTNTAWSEAYNALSQGVADGAEAPLSLIYSSKLYETKKRISLTGHLVHPTAIVMSQKVYDSLSEKGQAALDKVGREFSRNYAQTAVAIEDEYQQILADAGIVFNDVDTADFEQAAQEVPNAFPEWSPGLYERAQTIISNR